MAFRHQERPFQSDATVLADDDDYVDTLMRCMAWWILWIRPIIIVHYRCSVYTTYTLFFVNALIHHDYFTSASLVLRTMSYKSNYYYYYFIIIIIIIIQIFLHTDDVESHAFAGPRWYSVVSVTRIHTSVVASNGRQWQRTTCRHFWTHRNVSRQCHPSREFI